MELIRGALLAIIILVSECKTGACSLSSIMERTLLDLMFELPSRDDVARIVIIRGYAEGTREPELYVQRGDDIRST